MPKLSTRPRKQTEKKFEREILYPNPTSDVCRGDTAITAEDAKQLLGWEEVSEGGGHYVREVYALAKVRVRCTNNVTNRPLYKSVVQTLKQEILRRRWQFNGEAIIIGKTGLLLNGQHTLLALVLANLEWEADQERWSDYWTTPPTIDKVVTSGVDEGDATVNTMDTCKPRSLTDVLCRSEYFSTLKDNERRSAARMTDYAVRLLWYRTGAGLDAFAPRRTHAESLAFLDAHPRLLEAVKHVHGEEGTERRISRYMGPGYAAGLMYLMACSETDPTEYRKMAYPDESALNFDLWDKAADFIVLLASAGNETSAVRTVMARSIEDGGLSNAERWGIVSNAWLTYKDGDPITKTSIQLEYADDDEGSRRLVEHPSVGGIDLGDPSTVDESMLILNDPCKEEIERAAAKEKSRSLKKVSVDRPVAPRPEKLLKPRRASSRWAKGDIAWISDVDGEHYLGQLTEQPWDCDDNNCRCTVRDSKGDEWEVLYSDLQLERPTITPVKPAVRVARASTTKLASDRLFKVGDLLWVRDKGNDPWRGKVIELSKNSAKLIVHQGFAGCGTVKMVWLKDLAREQPTVW